MQLKTLSGACLAALFFPLVPAALAATQSNISDCQYGASGVNSFTDIFTCGTVSGSLRTLYYSTHNAYFSKGFNQDTLSYGGDIKYETAPFYGFRAGVSGIFLRGIDHPDEAHTISDIGDNQTNVGEAYLSWQLDDFKITAGDQRINIPFVGDYDWRITPILFRGVDANYGDSTNYLHATKVWRYKPWGDDQFLNTTAYTDVDERTNGMWALGGGRGTQWDGKKLTGQLWYQEYADYTRLVYGESHLQWQDALFQPDFGVQFIRGTREGMADAGEFFIQIRRTNDIAVGVVAKIELHPRTDTPAQGDFINGQRSIAILHVGMVVPWRIHMCARVGAHIDELHRPALFFRQVVRTEPRKHRGKLKRACRMVMVINGR